MTEGEVADEVRQILVAAKHRAGIRAVAVTNPMIDAAAPSIARLLLRMVDTAVGAHTKGAA
jgi:hypothetical protein